MPTPRKAISEHELSGTRVHYVDDDSDADVKPGRPKYPRGISPEAKSVFKRLVKLLARRKTLTEGDAELLRLYAVTFDRHRRALEHLATEGEVCAYTRFDSNNVAHSVYKENIHLKIATDAEKFMRACLNDCGLNPMSRGKVKLAVVKPPQEPEAFPSKEETTLPSAEIDLSQIDETKVSTQ
jgi:P27 family predicted phage terminase small subunit